MLYSPPSYCVEMVMRSVMCMSPLACNPYKLTILMRIITVRITLRLKSFLKNTISDSSMQTFKHIDTVYARGYNDQHT